MKRPDWLRVKAGLLEPEHVEAIGPALWEFELLIHWQTDDDGTVNGGAPIRAAEIAEALGRSVRTVERNLARLSPYLETRRTPYGVVYRILKASKFERTAKSGGSDHREPPKVADLFGGEIRQICRSDPPLLVERSAISGGNKEEQKQKQKVASQKTRRLTASKKPFPCIHAPRCSTRLWHVCVEIDQAAGGPAGQRYTNVELKQAKALADVPDEEIRATVRFMLETNGAFWAKTPINPATVAKHLKVYRRNQSNAAPTAKYHQDWPGDPV